VVQLLVEPIGSSADIRLWQFEPANRRGATLFTRRRRRIEFPSCDTVP
jgi:hypothetical protein